MNTINTPKKTFKQEFFELLRFTIMLLVIIVPIRVFVINPFIVNGESMLPTLENGDYLFIDQISYYRQEPQRGEVIVFRYPSNHKRFLIKRIIALPGETVSIEGRKITITKNDDSVLQLNEDYLNGEFSSYGSWELSDNEYFVMGDNRRNSSDSRAWGPLKEDLIVGRALLRLFPITDVALFPGRIDTAELETTLSQ